MLQDALTSAREALDDCFAAIEDEDSLDEHQRAWMYQVLSDAELAFEALSISRSTDGP